MTTAFNPGDAVQVRRGSPPGHIRTPFYVRGCKGRIERIAGEYRNPEELAFGRFDAPIVPLYMYVSSKMRFGRNIMEIHEIRWT